MAKEIKRMYRATKNDSVLGAGIANYLIVDPVLIRLGWVLITIFSWGLGIIAYLFAWMIMPRK
jgi:phage shock protein C